MTLDEFAVKILNPEARKLLAGMLGVPVESVTDDMVRRYIEQLPEDAE